MRSSVLVGAVLALLSAAPAQAAPELTLTASHARDPLLRAQAPNTTLHPAVLTLRVANTGADPTDGSAVTVTETLPAGLSALVNNPGAGAGPVAASGPGWTCTGGTTSRCTRSDVLAAGAAYPPITVTVGRGQRRRGTLRRTATVAGGGDAGGGSAADDVGVVADACPNGWAASALNPERADGCSLLDLVWAGSRSPTRPRSRPRSRTVAAQFRAPTRTRSIAATRAPTAGPDNSCATRVALDVRRRAVLLPPGHAGRAARQGRARDALRPRHAAGGQPAPGAVRARRGPHRPRRIRGITPTSTTSRRPCSRSRSRTPRRASRRSARRTARTSSGRRS